MDESEKRRERLKAMRLEATSEIVSSSTSSSFSQQTLNSPLANPLLDNFDSSVAATPPPRFDFYTDPMAAYATDKRRTFIPRPNFSPSYGNFFFLIKFICFVLIWGLGIVVFHE